MITVNRAPIRHMKAHYKGLNQIDPSEDTFVKEPGIPLINRSTEIHSRDMHTSDYKISFILGKDI